MRLVGHGHAAIRATHRKTLELTHDADITERATCVVAVGVDVDGPRAPLAGDVRITIAAGGESCTVEARANSSWDPTGTAIIRRSPLRLPDTFATHASAAASDLPRQLVEALRRPDNTVEVTVELAPGRACVVLFALDPGHPDGARLRAELAAAELVVAEDEVAARLLGERVAHGPVAVDRRVLVVATAELPGRTVLAALAETDVETVGLSPALAAAAASPSRAQLVLAEDGADPRATLRAAPAAARVVVRVPAAEVDGLLAVAAARRGTSDAVLVQPFAAPMRVHADRPVVLPNRDDAYVCFDAASERSALDPRVRAALAALLADGVPTKTAATALAELTGWPRRRAYDYVVEQARTSGSRPEA